MTRWLALVGLVIATCVTLTACKDRRPPPPPCGDVNRAVTTACVTPAPLYCETATDDHIRCVDEAVQSMTSCGVLRQATTRCLVKYGQ